MNQGIGLCDADYKETNNNLLFSLNIIYTHSLNSKRNKIKRKKRKRSKTKWEVLLPGQLEIHSYNFIFLKILGH